MLGDSRAFQAAAGVLPYTIIATLSCVVVERAELVTD